MTNTDPNKTKYFPKFDWPRIDNPKVIFPLKGQNLADLEKRETAALDAVKKAISNNKDDVAALIIEPIQGEGGDNHFRGEFLRALRQICDESEVFLVLDEVQTGVGMTGKFWCYEHFGFEPDVIAFGKKTQVCGIFVSGRVDEVEKNCFVESSRINSTWGGNLVDMLRANRFLEVIDRDMLVDNASIVGAYALERFESMQKEFPDTLTNARGRGLFLAIDMKDASQRGKVLKTCLENGALILPCGDSTIRFRPPLIASKTEIDQAVEILSRSITEVRTGAPMVSV